MEKDVAFANGLDELDVLIRIEPADYNSVEKLAKLSGFDDIEEFESSVVMLDELMDKGIWVWVDDGDERVSVDDFPNVMGPYAKVRVLDFMGGSGTQYVYTYVPDVEAYRFNDQWYAKFDKLMG